MARIGFAAFCCLLVPAFWANAASSVLPAKVKEPGPSRDLPLTSLEARHHNLAKFILDKTSFSARGPAEVFQGKPSRYLWLLDHPHRCVGAWRKLGATCVDIAPKAGGKFSWTDEHGSEVIWEAALKSPSMRVWVAEGKVRPGPLLPMVPVKALVVLRHHEAKMPDGSNALHHQADLFVHADSKTAHMLLRMLGPSASRMAEDGLSQLQLFFSGLSWYLDRHPDEVKDLFPEAE